MAIALPIIFDASSPSVALSITSMTCGSRWEARFATSSAGTASSSCAPHNHTFGLLDLATVRRVLVQSVGLGVKEYYFTGGEPFLNPDMVAILELTLQYGPATVLTNGTVFKDAWLRRLAQAEANSLYSLEFRVSIDGFTAEVNDPIRAPAPSTGPWPACGNC